MSMDKRPGGHSQKGRHFSIIVARAKIIEAGSGQGSACDNHDNPPSVNSVGG
jgi:hypothetical protein